jgi:hypothetical protein
MKIQEYYFISNKIIKKSNLDLSLQFDRLTVIFATS